VGKTSQGRHAVIALRAMVVCGLIVGVSVETVKARPVVAAPSRPMASANDSMEAARTVDRFHQALARGDSAAVLGLLTPNATIVESGDVETFTEYRAHHLPADIEFARTVKAVRSPTRVTVRGDAAWAVATSTVRGNFRGRPVDSVGAELMVLTRSPAGWRIVAIHWSSHKRST
jgi:ketosteroid isomerase-like protein